MEIPVIYRISGFEAGINRLQNPSFVSRLFHLVGIEEIYKSYSLWTWGALILAFLATFSSLTHRTKRLILRLCKRSSATSAPLLRPVFNDNNNNNDDDDDDDNSEDESCSSFSSDNDGEESEIEEDFGVAGSCNYEENQRQICKPKLRRNLSYEDCFSWFDFTDRKSVVKSWDGLGLRLGFENSLGSFISMWDLNKEEKISSFFSGMCQIPAVSMSSPAVILSAGLENSRNVAMRVWDTRIGRQIPAVYEEWQPKLRRIVGIDSAGVEKVYVRDDGNGTAVGDFRKVGLPLDNVTESDGTTWWDADAVIVDDEGDDNDDGFYNESLSNGRRSVVSRCSKAVKSYLF